MTSEQDFTDQDEPGSAAPPWSPGERCGTPARAQRDRGTERDEHRANPTTPDQGGHANLRQLVLDRKGRTDRFCACEVLRSLLDRDLDP